MRTLLTLTAATLIAVAPLTTSFPDDPSSSPADPVPEDVRGSGWGSFAACTACVAGGFTLLMGGQSVILAAIWAKGSTVALGACIAACAAAVD